MSAGLLNNIFIVFFVENLKLWNEDVFIVAHGDQISIVTVDIRACQIELLLMSRRECLLMNL